MSKYMLRSGDVLAVLTLQGASGQAAPAADSPEPAPATLVIKAATGATLGERFLGISFEKNLLAQPPLTKGNLAQFLKTLGPGVLRFGGNQVDKTFWTSTGEKPPDWGLTTVTPAGSRTPGDAGQGQRLAAAVRPEPQAQGRRARGGRGRHRQADPRRCAAGHRGGQRAELLLQGDRRLQPRPVPRRLRALPQGLAKAAPGLGLIGPGRRLGPERHRVPDRVRQAPADQPRTRPGGPDHPLLSGTAPATPPIPTMAQLLSREFHDRIKARIKILVDSAKPLGLNTRLTEANSLTCGGVPASAIATAPRCGWWTRPCWSPPAVSPPRTSTATSPSVADPGPRARPTPLLRRRRHRSGCGQADCAARVLRPAAGPGGRHRHLLHGREQRPRDPARPRPPLQRPAEGGAGEPDGSGERRRPAGHRRSGGEVPQGPLHPHDRPRPRRHHRHDPGRQDRRRRRNLSCHHSQPAAHLRRHA